MTNASPVVFDITATETVKGLFLVGGIVAAQTKGDHAASGILWATALFTGGDVAVNNEDQLKVTYSVSADTPSPKTGLKRVPAQSSFHKEMQWPTNNLQMAESRRWRRGSTIPWGV